MRVSGNQCQMFVSGSSAGFDTLWLTARHLLQFKDSQPPSPPSRLPLDIWSEVLRYMRTSPVAISRLLTLHRACRMQI